MDSTEYESKKENNFHSQFQSVMAELRESNRSLAKKVNEQETQILSLKDELQVLKDALVSIKTEVRSHDSSSRLPHFPSPQSSQLPRVTSRGSHFNSQYANSLQREWAEAANTIYEMRTKNLASNLSHVQHTLAERPDLFEKILDICPRFDFLLGLILQNKLAFRVKTVYSSSMADLSESDCEKIGRSLSSFLRRSRTGKDALSRWKGNYPLLIPLFDVENFDVFMTVIANRLMRDSLYGTMLRVGVGAILSSVDAITDILVVAQYYREGLEDKAKILLMMITTNVIIQEIIVLLQYRKKPLRVIFTEFLTSLFFLRPAMDAYRVSINYETPETVIDPLSELIANKNTELATESIPGCILQFYVWLRNPTEAGITTLISIGISALTTGFTSALISFDMDLDGKHRMMQPNFYGYLPEDNTARGQCFFLMVFIASVHNISRTISIALLASSSKTLAFAFFGCEMVFYVLIKLLRRDFIYWPPLKGKAVVFIVSLFARLIIKTIVDFSGCFHMRHPYELGGIMFSVTLFWAQLSPFVALTFYEGDAKESIASYLIVAFIAWLIMTVMFLRLIKDGYGHTFYGIKTASEYTVELFQKAKSDELKFDAVFTNHLSFTSKIHGDVKVWLETTVAKLEEEKPAWWDIEIVPDDFLPTVLVEEKGGKARPRRNSLTGKERMPDMNKAAVAPLD